MRPGRALRRRLKTKVGANNVLAICISVFSVRRARCWSTPVRSRAGCHKSAVMSRSTFLAAVHSWLQSFRAVRMNMQRCCMGLGAAASVPGAVHLLTPLYAPAQSQQAISPSPLRAPQASPAAALSLSCMPSWLSRSHRWSAACGLQAGRAWARGNTICMGSQGSTTWWGALRCKPQQTM